MRFDRGADGYEPDVTPLLRSAPVARNLGTMALAAALLSGCGDDTGPGKRSGAETDPPSSAPTDTTTKAPSAAAPSYLAEGVWHRPDGSEVPLPDNPFPYDEAVVWGDLLVASRWDGEVFSIADVIDRKGNIVDTFPVSGTVVANTEHTAIAWVDPDGALRTRGEHGSSEHDAVLADLDLSAAGESIRMEALALVGGPDCQEGGDDCVVYVADHGSGSEDDPGPGSLAYDAHGEVSVPLSTGSTAADRSPSILWFNDVEGDLASTTDLVDETAPKTCGGLYRAAVDGPELRWDTCARRLEDIAPGGRYVAGVGPSYASGIGDSTIAVLDAEDGTEVATYEAPRDGHIAGWAWADEESLLVVAWTGGEWALTQVGRPDPLLTLPGEAEQTPIVLVR